MKLFKWVKDITEKLSDEEHDELMEGNDAEACYNTAMDFYYGNNGKKEDMAKAAEWCRKAAEMGHAEAQAQLADFYWEGVGVEWDPDLATEWYSKAAKQGNERAIDFVNNIEEQKSNYAVIYHHFGEDCYYGRNGKEKNEAEAAEWFLKASHLGHVGAQLTLGHMLLSRGGMEEAFELFSLAAEQGDAEAQYQLAHAYNFGLGTKMSKENAKKWYRKAAEQGHEVAKCELDVLESAKSVKAEPKKSVAPTKQTTAAKSTTTTKSTAAAKSTTTAKSTTVAPTTQSVRKVLTKDIVKGSRLVGNIAINEGVEEIGDGAFENCLHIRSVSFPKSLKRIGANAFKDCKNIKKVYFSEGLISIGDAAFYGCPIKIAFFPDTLESIGSKAFYNNRLEGSLVLPKALKTIGDLAFRFANITSLSIPSGVKKIGRCAFCDCFYLKSVDLGEVETIESQAFDYCYNLKDVYFPDTLKDIETGAFSECENLKKIEFAGDNISYVDDYAFEGCNNILQVIVPSGRLNYYRNKLPSSLYYYIEEW